MQIMFPHDFIECKIDKQMMNSTKNSFYTSKYSNDDGDDYDEDDIPELIESEEFDTSIYNEKSPNYFTNYINQAYLPFN